MNQVFYAVGDIHGRDDLLALLHDHIRDHHALLHSDRAAKLVYVGDYIDGGAQSAAVLDRVMAGLPGFETVALMGNHEAMLLECLSTDNREAWYTWLSNGGEETLASFGISLRFGGYDPEALRDAVGPQRCAWLASLRLMYEAGPYVFVHAGVAPGIPLGEQSSKDLLWIRSRFLDSEEDHGRIVVHGHTPGDDPVVRANRICVDTGATSYGVLTAAVLDGTRPPLFLRASGAIGKGG